MGIGMAELLIIGAVLLCGGVIVVGGFIFWMARREQNKSNGQ